MSIELEVSIEKERWGVFENTTIIFLTFLQEGNENYVSLETEYNAMRVIN